MNPVLGIKQRWTTKNVCVWQMVLILTPLVN